MGTYFKTWLAITIFAFAALIECSLTLHVDAVSSSSLAVQNCVSPPANLVSWWPGDEDAVDIMGSNNGTVQNGVMFTSGMVRSAFQLDGVDDYVAVPDAPSLQIVDALTVDAWIKPSSPLQAYAPIVKKPGTGNNSGYALEFLFNSVTFWVYVNGEGWVNSPWASVPIGEWSHVAGVYDGSTVSLYVNGNLIDSPTSAPGNIVAPNGELHIGHDPAHVDRFYHGLIDEVELFNRALSASEIQAIYAADSAGKCAFGQKAVNATTAFHSIPLTYTISLNNMGLADPGNITVTDTVPLSLTYSTGSLSATAGSYAYYNGVITWTGTVSASEIVTITFGTYVSQSAPIGASIVNSAVINREGKTITRTATVTVDTPPAITLMKTVGTNPAVCAVTDTLSVPYNSTVYYCYTATNTGSVTLTLHTLTDNRLGTILNNFPYSLAPGASTFVTQSATLTQTTVNTAQWLAGNGVYTVTATAQATVTVSTPPIIGISPVSLLSAQKINLQLDQTLTVSNTGGANLSWNVTEHGGPSCAGPVGLSWISLTPVSGTIAPANQTPLQITFDSTGLTAGSTYTGTLCFISNDPNSPQVTVPLTLQVLQFKIHLPLIMS